MFRVVAYSIFCGGEEGKGLGLGQKAERAAAREKERIQSDLVMGYIKCWSIKQVDSYSYYELL